MVQSMVKTDPHDLDAVVRQVNELAELGCGLVRLAVPDRPAASLLREVIRRTDVALVADIHFDPRLAIEALRAGVHKIRLNPGNLRGGGEALRRVVKEAASRGVPIRVGSNSGSVGVPEGRDAESSPAERLARAVIGMCEELDSLDFRDIVVSAKSPYPLEMIEANRILARRTDYPLHLGVTAAGPPSLAWARSAVGTGALLADGIGDTIRVSYTGPPHAEVAAGFRILEAVGLAPGGLRIVSCPTCGRCKADVVALVEEVRKRLSHIESAITVAVMGCEVNGPGEAAEADVGLACTGSGGWIFSGGEKKRSVRKDEMLEVLIREVETLARSEESCTEGGVKRAVPARETGQAR